MTSLAKEKLLLENKIIENDKNNHVENNTVLEEAENNVIEHTIETHRGPQTPPNAHESVELAKGPQTPEGMNHTFWFLVFYPKVLRVLG